MADRLLVGEYPGSNSRAEAMERLRAFLGAGITCFIDLTQPQESASYEGMLPFATPSGRRVEYLRQPILDHGVPDERGTMERILALLNDALAAGHHVYLHCRAGIGRSATVAGCWLAEQRGDAAAALDELQQLWQQSAKSRRWAQVPETEEQARFVRDWLAGAARVTARRATVPASAPTRAGRLRGALLGLALGDALGAARGAGRVGGELAYTQPTALTLCLADSLLATGRCDARDQIERYVRWQREGLRAATGEPGQASPDVAKALGTYLWRGLPMAGSHDPRDRGASSLPRVVAAAMHGGRDPLAAIATAAECSRTTHQSPIVLDACRYFAALLLGAFAGQPLAQLLDGVPEPARGCWARKPLKREVLAVARTPPPAEGAVSRRDTADVLEALATMRSAVHRAPDFTSAVRIACESGTDAALDGALAGALFGALYGEDEVPADRLAALTGLAQVREVAERLVNNDEREVA